MVDVISQKKIDSLRRTIPSAEVDFHPHSFGDSQGRLFWWKGGLYRGIRFEQAPFFSRLLREGVIEKLVERGLLIKTDPTFYKLDGYEMVVRHKPIPFPSYPNEWCVAMLKAAAAAILDLAIELTRRNLSLKDAHPWNVLFDRAKPVFVDLTSIVPLAQDAVWPAYDEFCRFCYYPLILMCHGRERIARCLLPEYEGVLRSDLSTLPRRFLLSTFALSKLIDRAKKAVRLVDNAGGKKAQLSFLERLRRDVEHLTEPAYESGGHPSSDSYSEQGMLHGIFNELRPASVLDINSRDRSPLMQAARSGIKVVYFGTDPARVTAVYRDALQEGLPILPLIMDFIKPTPSVGYSSHYTVAATERFKCDMVMALSLVDHLVFDRYFNFDLIAEGISSFSKRWAVVGFNPPDRVGRERTELFPWYTLDNLADALRKQFESVEVVMVGPASRVLLLCAKY